MNLISYLKNCEWVQLIRLSGAQLLKPIVWSIILLPKILGCVPPSSRTSHWWIQY